MAIELNNISIVQWFPEQERHRCGYCKRENSSISYGMWADSMTVEDYQNLIDRGWRRSGKYCYKPIMTETCCPQYTIRCDAISFKLSKSQKKVIKKMNKYLNEGILNKDYKQQNGDDDDSAVSTVIIKERPTFSVDYEQMDKKMKIDEMVCELNTEDTASCSTSTTNKIIKSNAGLVKENADKSESMSVVSNSNHKADTVKKGLGADPNKPPSQKAKVLRMERKRKKLFEKGVSLGANSGDCKGKTLAQLLTEGSENAKHKLEIKLINTSMPNNELDANIEIEYEIYRKYQMVVHNDPPSKCSLNGFQRFLVQTPLKIKLVKPNFKDGSLQLHAKLFEKYQMIVHNEKASDCDLNQFVDFLVTNPFKGASTCQDETTKLGSFHQQYWIQDKLIAVGVVDILPRCISSVYFFYDPDYRNLTLGTYGSLREIEFTQRLQTSLPTIEHYYMGFYIHSCPKMRYKGKLHSSYLLCPETYKWFPISRCIPKLEVSPYSRLNEDIDDTDEEDCMQSDVDNIKILVRRQYTTYRCYKYKNRDKEMYVRIGNMVGKKCAETLMFIPQ